jgi:hypothetical protein
MVKPRNFIYRDNILSPVVTNRIMRRLDFWERGFESHRGHGRLSLLSVGCCQVEVSATGRSLFQKSPTQSVSANHRV